MFSRDVWFVLISYTNSFTILCVCYSHVQCWPQRFCQNHQVHSWYDETTLSYYI